jgi:hypothetical protein
MDKYTFNSDKISVWQQCRRKFYLKYIKEIKVPDIENNLELGKSVHALINYYLKGYEVDFLLKNASDDVRNVWKVAKKSNFLSKKDVFLTEWQFNCNLKGADYWLNGRIDAVFFDRNTSKYTIIDWKTGQNIPKDAKLNPQTMIYLYSFFKAQNDLKISLNHADLAFEYVKISDSIMTTRIDYSSELEKAYEKRLLVTFKEIENEKDFSRAEVCTSKYCEYSNICGNL